MPSDAIMINGILKYLDEEDFLISAFVFGGQTGHIKRIL